MIALTGTATGRRAINVPDRLKWRELAHKSAKGRDTQHGTFEPLTKGYVEVIKNALPKARIIWANSTPVLLEGDVKQLDPVINAKILEQNRLAAKVMTEAGVPANDFYSLLADKLELARGGKDKFHWTPPAYKILSEKCAEAVLRALSTTRAAKPE